MNLAEQPEAQISAQIIPFPKRPRRRLATIGSAKSWSGYLSIPSIYYVVAFAVIIALCATAAFAAETDVATLSKAFLEEQAKSTGVDIEVSIGEFDPRAKLAPCQRFEPFVPNGFKLWGKTMLGVRCAEGANWTTYVPVQVKVYSPVLLSARALAAGQTLNPEDFRIERMEITQWPAGSMISAGEVSGRVTTRGIMPNQALRRDMFRIPPAVIAGDAVKVLFRGEGFSVSVDGKALTQGGEGDTVQIMTSYGRLVNGTARQGKIVEMRL